MCEVFKGDSLARLEAIRAKLDGEEAATLILQLIENVKYVNGCVARGNGSDLSENPLENVFEYIKQLEAQLTEAKSEVEEQRLMRVDAENEVTEWMQRAEAKEGWISVEDSLPEERKRLLVYAKPCKFKNDNVAYLGEGYLKSRLNKEWGTRGVISKDITHWMYLPESPEQALKKGE